MSDLIERQPDRQNRRIFQEIIVEHPSISTYPEHEGKPYFSIKYMEDGQAYIGYGTYKPEVLSEYLKMYFISAQPDVPDINVGDINKFIDDLEAMFADIRERHVDDSVCGLCEYDGAYMGQSGDWCNECPGFDKDDCFKLSDKTRKKWTEIIKSLPSVQPLIKERKKGRWIDSHTTCSECGWQMIDDITETPNMVGFNYCPNCGAKMINKDFSGQKKGDKSE